jgi:alpha-N-arabinofuranosidase
LRISHLAEKKLLGSEPHVHMAVVESCGSAMWLWGRLAMVCVLLWVGAPRADGLQLWVHTQQAQRISSQLFGLFFEEISHAGAGGLYGEMVADRSFFMGSERSELGFWTVVPHSGFVGPPPPISSLLDKNVVCGNQTASLRLPVDTGLVAVRNSGYWGLNVTAGAAYNLTVLARVQGDVGALQATLMPPDTRLDAEFPSVQLHADPTEPTDRGGTWVRLRGVLVGDEDMRDAQLEIRVAPPHNGTVWLAMVSLFPTNTFRARPNGLRHDLATMLQVSTV